MSNEQANSGWFLPPGSTPPDLFTCIVTGDPRLPKECYPFVRDTLDKLLASRLPALRVNYVWRSTVADHMAGRYLRERRHPS
jgi:hypothetical protein